MRASGRAISAKPDPGWPTPYRVFRSIPDATVHSPIGFLPPWAHLPHDFRIRRKPQKQAIWKAGWHQLIICPKTYPPADLDQSIKLASRCTIHELHDNIEQPAFWLAHDGLFLKIRRDSSHTAPSRDKKIVKDIWIHTFEVKFLYVYTITYPIHFFKTLFKHIYIFGILTSLLLCCSSTNYQQIG